MQSQTNSSLSGEEDNPETEQLLVRGPEGSRGKQIPVASTSPSVSLLFSLAAVCISLYSHLYFHLPYRAGSFSSSTAFPIAQFPSETSRWSTCEGVEYVRALNHYQHFPPAALRSAMSELDMFQYQEHNTTEAGSPFSFFAPTPILSQVDTREACLYLPCQGEPCERIPTSLAAFSSVSVSSVLNEWKSDAEARQHLQYLKAEEWDREFLQSFGDQSVNQGIFPKVYFQWIQNLTESHPEDYYPLHFLSHPVASTDRTLVWVDTRCTPQALFSIRATYLLLNVDRGLEVELERRLAEEFHLMHDQPSFAFHSRLGSNNLFSYLPTAWALTLFITKEVESCYVDALDIRVGGIGEHIAINIISSAGRSEGCRLPFSLDYFDTFPSHIEYLLLVQADVHMLNSVASDVAQWRRILRYGHIGASWSDSTEGESWGWNGMGIRRRSFLQRTMRYINCNITLYPFHCQAESRYVMWKQENHDPLGFPHGVWADDGVIIKELETRREAFETFFPLRAETHRFSAESHIRDFPFFSHASYKYNEGKEQLLRIYSRSKSFFMRPHAVHAALADIESGTSHS